MNQRRLLVGAGLLAAVGGVAWRTRPSHVIVPTQPGASGVASSAVSGAASGAASGPSAIGGQGDAEPQADQWWAQQFAGLNGEPVATAPFKGRPLLVNFWATWCPPCVREMPELDRFYREFSAQGWQVLGLAADSAAAVNKFVQERPVSFPLALAGFAGIAWSKALGNAQGGLPFTVVFDAQGAVSHRHLGATTYAGLREALKI